MDGRAAVAANLGTDPGVVLAISVLEFGRVGGSFQLFWLRVIGAGVSCVKFLEYPKLDVFGCQGLGEFGFWEARGPLADWLGRSVVKPIEAFS